MCIPRNREAARDTSSNIHRIQGVFSAPYHIPEVAGMGMWFCQFAEDGFVVASVSQLEYVVWPGFLGLQWHYPGPVNFRRVFFI